ncbi:MAG: Gfo/Idh/MocA family oxidoreductase [Nitrospinae bacterium]|nr:Gfo/Idh/MocA family oxidoreductase [Nitrospinota bacterium]MBF0634701.1 Gfo/Idh/MocA family oxidoreductase [Nitrospinota bacterium]
MHNKSINAGVIGVGRMGQYHVGVYSELTGVNLVGVVDVSEARGAEIAKKYRTQSYKDFRSLFGKVDVVSIAVPTSMHYAVAKECLQAGVHCLLEKPITNNLAEAEELFNIAAKNGAILHVGHVERFNGAVQELSKAVRDPIFIESRRLGPFDPRIKDDGVVLDLMIHDIDIILNLVKSPVVEINAIGATVFSDKEDVVNVQLRFENGCLANILASRATQEKIRTLAVTQPSEYIFLDYTTQDILVHRRASSQHQLGIQELKYTQESLIERIFVHRENPLKLELRHLIDCVANGADRRISVENELMSLRVALSVLDRLTPVRLNAVHS